MSSVAATMLSALEMVRTQTISPNLDIVLVGGYAHMSHL
jgi:hypothetical protein